MNCPTCARPLVAVAGSSLVTCPRCQKTHVPVAATELSLLARTQVGEARPVATISLPREFRDRYELGEVLGSGAMGMVCRARDRSMDREVAVKFLMLIDQTELLQRFLTEGRLLARIRHENVVPVYDLEDLGGHPYIVTECLEGGTLRELLDARALSTAEAIEIMTACLDGLAAFHAAGIVHRDLKPENILFTKDRIPKISDLGIAKEMSAASVTKTGALIGTPRYMAPEQARTAGASYASDVHAMGAILYEMVTGASPFEADNLADLLKNIMTVEPPAIDEGMATPLPPALVKVVARALAKAPEARPSATEFAAELRKAASSRALAPRAETRPATPRGIVTMVAPAAPRSLFVPALAFGGLALVILAPFLFVIYRSGLGRPAMPPREPTKPAPVAPLMADRGWDDLRSELVREASEVLRVISRSRELRTQLLSEPWGRRDDAFMREMRGRLSHASFRMRTLLSDPRIRGDLGKASLDVQAMRASAEVTDWELGHEIVRFQRYEGLDLFADRPPQSSIQEYFKLQRTLQDIRRALSRPQAELALAPAAVESLLITFWQIAWLSRAMSMESARAALRFEDDPIPGRRNAESRQLASAIERSTAEITSAGANRGDPPVHRVLATMWSLLNSSPGSRGKPAPERVAGFRLDLRELESALGPGSLGLLIARVESEFPAVR